MCGGSRTGREGEDGAARSLGADVAALAAAHLGAAGGAGDRAVNGGGGAFTSACYIEGSLPALLYLAHKNAVAPADALIANSNVGGENCHRGAALDALVGAVHGMRAWAGTGWPEALADAPKIAAKADAFAAAARAAWKAGRDEAGGTRGRGFVSRGFRAAAALRLHGTPSIPPTCVRGSTSARPL